MSDRPDGDVRASMERRDFLRLGAAGIAASAAGTTPDPTASETVPGAPPTPVAPQEVPPWGRRDSSVCLQAVLSSITSGGEMRG